MTIFFISGIMTVPAFADSNTETRTCGGDHIPVERTNGKIVCMTERTAERTVERFGWTILNDPAVTTKSVSDDSGSVPSDETIRPDQTKPVDDKKTTVCLNDTCVDVSPGEDVAVEVGVPVHTQKTEDGKSVIEKKMVTSTFVPVFNRYVAPEGCTPTEGVMEWGARYQGSKILEDLQNVIDSGETRLCVTIFADVTVGGSDNNQYVSRANIHEFLVQQGADVEGHIGPGGIKKISGRTIETIDAAIPLSLLDEIANRDDVTNIDVMGKNTSTPYHIRIGQDSKISSILQKEIDSKQQNCPPIKDCPPLKKNADGKYIVGISIRLDLFTYDDIESQAYKRGDRPKYDDRGEWYDQRVDELNKQNAIAGKPVLDLLAENNIEIISITRGYFLYAFVPIDFLPQLVNHDLVGYMDSMNTFGTLDV